MLTSVLKILEKLFKVQHRQQHNITPVFSKYMSNEDYNYLIKQTKFNIDKKNYIFK